MKAVHAVLFFAFVGVSFAKKLTEDELTPEDKQCIKDVGLEIQAVLDAMSDDYIAKEGDAKLNEYTVCSFKKSNLIDENDELKYDAIKSLFVDYVQLINNKVVDKNEASSAAVDSCKNVKGDTLGDRIVKFNNCCVRYVIAH